MTANEFLAGIENYEKFDPSNGTVEGKTYVVVPTTTETGKNLRDRHTHRRQYSVDRAYPQWFGARNDISNNEFWHLRVVCEAAKSTEENPLTPAAEKDKIEKARDAALKNLKA